MIKPQKKNSKLYFICWLKTEHTDFVITLIYLLKNIPVHTKKIIKTVSIQYTMTESRLVSLFGLIRQRTINTINTTGISKQYSKIIVDNEKETPFLNLRPDKTARIKSPM